MVSWITGKDFMELDFLLMIFCPEGMASGVNCEPGHIDGVEKLCNIGDTVRVSFPDMDDKKNVVEVSFNSSPGTTFGSYRCCATRHQIDEKIEELGTEMGSLVGQTFSREVSCSPDDGKTC